MNPFPSKHIITMPVTPSETILRDIRGGLVACTVGIAFSIANGALIYSGSMPSLLERGIAAGLITTAVVGIFVALLSDFRPALATASATTGAPLGAIMVTLGPALVGLPPDQAANTVYALIAVTTATTGAVLILLGSARLGNIVRYIPHPVVAGFMGVNGTLLLFGATRLATGIPLAWANLPRYGQPQIMAELAATVAFAIAARAVQRIRTPLAFPILLIVTIAVASIFFKAGEPAIADGRVSGWFLAHPTSLTIAHPILLDLSAPVAWHLVWPYLPSIAAFALLVTLATLLGSIGLENALNVTIAFDRELRAQGVAVVASAVAGGFVGNISVGSTTAAVASGAKNRLSGIMAAAAALLFLFVGWPLLPFIPRFVLSGLLLEIGAAIVWRWCWRTRQEMPLAEWALVIGIVVITAWIGLVAAVVAGIIAGCILFALDLSRIDIVRRAYGVDQRMSSLVRPVDERAILARDGGAVQIVELNGTLFFGSAYRILDRVRHLLSSPTLKTVVLDFTRVVGGDSSTCAILARMRRLLAARDVSLAIAGANPALVRLLRASGAFAEDDAVFATTDAALEAGETAILLRADNRVAAPAEDWLTETLGNATLAGTLIPHLSRAEYRPGTYLCREGEPTTTLLFIERGRVAVTVGANASERVVRVFGRATLTGEQGFILNKPRAANLRVEQAAVVWSLGRVEFDRLRSQEPDVVFVLLEHIIALQAERLAFATRQNAALA